MSQPNPHGQIVGSMKVHHISPVHAGKVTVTFVGVGELHGAASLSMNEEDAAYFVQGETYACSFTTP